MSLENRDAALAILDRTGDEYALAKLHEAAGAIRRGEMTAEKALVVLCDATAPLFLAAKLRDERARLVRQYEAVANQTRQ